MIPSLAPDSPAAAYRLFVINVYHPLRKLSGKRIHISTIVWNWETYPETARISLHQRGDEAPQATLTDGLSQPYWLISQQHVSQGCGETHTWIVVDIMRMEEWPWGKELQLWQPSGALDSRCCQAGQSHPAVSPPISLLVGHGESWGKSRLAVYILIQSGITVRAVGLWL